jgi:hypothetical protein
MERIKAEFASGKINALIWTANHVIFKKDDGADTDCRSELYDGPCLNEPRYWHVSDEHDRRRPILVEDAARMAGVYETLQNYRPYRQGGDASASILAVIKHTDFLPLLASRFGNKFTCSYTMEEHEKVTAHWTPYVIKVFLKFWPDGLEASVADKIAKAKADCDRRSETVIVSTCIRCVKSLTRANRIESRCLKDCHCHEHDGYFCSDKCMGPYFHRA